MNLLHFFNISRELNYVTLLSPNAWLFFRHQTHFLERPDYNPDNAEVNHRDINCTDIARNWTEKNSFSKKLV